MAMGAGLIGALVLTIFINGYVIVRDLTHGIVAAAIAVGAGSLYIFNPAFPIITGFVAGSTHTIIQNLVERGAIKKGRLISTVSWSLFGVQGLIGGFFATCWKGDSNINWTNTFSQTVLQNFGEQNEIYIALISMGMGLGFGILAGILIYCTTLPGRKEYFDDGFYWRNYDGIYTFRTRVEQYQEKKATPYQENPAIPERKESEREIKEREVIDYRESEVELSFEEGEQQEVQNQHAYL